LDIIFLVVMPEWHLDPSPVLSNWYWFYETRRYAGAEAYERGTVQQCCFGSDNSTFNRITIF
jgi:hypothetical protein